MRRATVPHAGPQGLLVFVVWAMGCLALLMAGPTLAADPDPSPGGSVGDPAGASAPTAPSSPSPAPTLTMAPLVTLRPIAAPPVASPLELADGYALGAADAPVTVDVWEDFQCPWCQAFTFEVKPLIVEEYVRSGEVRLVFHDLPFLGEESRWASVAASLAAEQDLFWPFHDYLFANLQGENRGSYSLDRMLLMAEAAGLDMDAFIAGLRVDAARARFARIQAEARAGAGALGIDSTPTVVVDGLKLESAGWESVSAAIEAALAAAAGGS